MSGYGLALLAALLPAFGNTLGGLIAEFAPVSNRVLSWALHAAARILFAVIGVELMPEALAVAPAVWVALAFIAGGAFSVLIDKLISHIHCRFSRSSMEKGPWMIYFGVSVDLFSDGIMIGTSATVTSALALLLAVGQMSADIPEGLATVATFQRSGKTSRQTRLLIGASFLIPIFLGTTLAYFGMRGLPDIYKYLLLAFTAGVLLSVAVEEMLVEAHESATNGGRLAETLSLVGGFGLFIVVTEFFAPSVVS